MERLEFPQTQCQAAVTRADITPPVGIFHRMWGAARHDRATGVHRPLLATLLWLQPANGAADQALVLVALDHCILDNPDIERIQRAAAAAAGVEPHQVLVTLSHTHAAGLMSRSRSGDPGGDLIGPYLDQVTERVAQLAREASQRLQAATVQYARGSASLARHRDYWDETRRQFVCGLHPDGPADDTLMVARVVGEGGHCLGTVVNYACHPTTLAWDNTLISPDYPGALRELVEELTGAPCLFLLGAAGDLGPRDGFVGDPAVADRHGRQLGYAALSALESLPSPGQTLAYQGPVVSGTLIGAWDYEPLTAAAAEAARRWQVDARPIDLPYRVDLPTCEETEVALRDWQRQETEAQAAGDAGLALDCRAMVEQMTRQLWRLQALHPGKAFHLPVTIAELGQALWVFVAGEHYQQLQCTLRERYPDRPVIVTTLTGGWQPGYIPTARTYGYGIYQEQIAVVAPGSLEVIQEEIVRRVAP